MNPNLYSIEIIAIFFLFFIYVLSGVMIEHHKIKYIHESGLIIVFSMLVSLYFHKYGIYIEFNEEDFFYLVLPPIIFAGGYNLQKRRFFTNYTYILLYGFWGTIANFIVMSVLTNLINNFQLIKLTRSLGLNDNVDGQLITLDSCNSFFIHIFVYLSIIEEILFFSAVICSTDSVAALTLIKRNEHPKLFSVIFGEGMINDAVSIILFQCVNMVNRQKQTESFNYQALIVKILYIGFLSVLVGVVGGIIPALQFKYMKHYSIPPICEISMVLFFGQFTYMVCEYLNLSGILGILIGSIVMSHYSYYNMTTVSQQTIGIILSTFSYFSEGFLFIYLGLSCWIRDSDWSISFFVCSLMAIFISRAVGVLGVTYIYKLYLSIWNQRINLDTNEIYIIYFAGLIRGAIAFGLVLSLRSRNFTLIKSNTLLLVLLTTIVIGGMMSFIIDYFIQCKQQKQVSKISGDSLDDELLVRRVEYANPIYFQFSNFDEEYFKPFFIHDYYNRVDEIEIIDKMFRNEDEENVRNPRLESFRQSIGINKNYINQTLTRKKNSFVYKDSDIQNPRIPKLKSESKIELQKIRIPNFNSENKIVADLDQIKEEKLK